MAKLSPTQSKERIISLDILRGIALLGILIINIQSFAMPGSAYLNPSSYGDLTGINYWVWVISFVLGDAKMMAIFSVRTAPVSFSPYDSLQVSGFIGAKLIWEEVLTHGFASDVSGLNCVLRTGPDQAHADPLGIWNGEIESTEMRAFIDFGGGRTLAIQQLQNETLEAFETRLSQVKPMGYGAEQSPISKQTNGAAKN